MKKVLNSKFVFILSALFLICLIGSAIYCTNFFLPNTVIQTILGEINIGGKNKGFLRQELVSQINEYNIFIIDKGGIKHNFKLSDIYSIDEIKLDELLKSKSYINWSIENQIDIGEYSSLSSEKIKSVLNEIRTNEDKKSESAYIYLNEKEKLFEIVPEVYGNEYIENIVEVFENDFNITKQEYNLPELNGYILPTILQDDEDLQKEVKEKNSYLETYIYFKFGDTLERIDKNVYFDWVSYVEEDEKISISLDEDSINSYVDGIVEKYDTLHKNREFKTSTNEIVSLNTGTYGWVLDRDFVYDTIIDCLLNRKSGTFDFKYTVMATVYDMNDIGNTYVEVSIENQKVWMYKDGECIVESPIVTGCVNLGHNTRKGVFTIYYKAKNVVLRGPGYASPVTFWMPFDGGIGLHDASWRDNFGGEIYKYNGSHGCVNMPYSAAETIYENIDVTVPIVVW